MKLRKMAKIKKRYNQAPHLTQDTTGEGNKHFLQILVLGLLYNTWGGGGGFMVLCGFYGQWFWFKTSQRPGLKSHSLKSHLSDWRSWVMNFEPLCTWRVTYPLHHASSGESSKFLKF